MICGICLLILFQPAFATTKRQGAGGMCTTDQVNMLKESFRDACTMTRAVLADMNNFEKVSLETRCSDPGSKKIPFGHPTVKQEEWQRVRNILRASFGRDPFSIEKGGTCRLSSATRFMISILPLLKSSMENRFESNCVIGYLNKMNAICNRQTRAGIVECTDRGWTHLGLEELDPENSQRRTIEQTRKINEGKEVVKANSI